MGFRDPRVLSEKLDSNSTNHLTAPPDAETAPDTDMQANDSEWRGGYVPSNATNPPASPPERQQDYYENTTSVTYPAGGPNTNVTRGPNEKDPAIAMAKGWNK